MNYEERRKSQWKYGESIEFTNNDKFPITFNITTTFDSVGKWFNMPETSFTVAPGATKTIKNTINKSQATFKV
jgi:hypothetical protein